MYSPAWKHPRWVWGWVNLSTQSPYLLSWSLDLCSNLQPFAKLECACFSQVAEPKHNCWIRCSSQQKCPLDDRLDEGVDFGLSRRLGGRQEFRGAFLARPKKEGGMVENSCNWFFHILKFIHVWISYLFHFSYHSTYATDERIAYSRFNTARRCVKMKMLRPSNGWNGPLSSCKGIRFGLGTRGFAAFVSAVTETPCCCGILLYVSHSFSYGVQKTVAHPFEMTPSPRLSPFHRFLKSGLSRRRLQKFVCSQVPRHAVCCGCELRGAPLCEYFPFPPWTRHLLRPRVDVIGISFDIGLWPSTTKTYNKTKRN